MEDGRQQTSALLSLFALVFFCQWSEEQRIAPVHPPLSSPFHSSHTPLLSAVYPRSSCLPTTPVSPLCHLPFSRSRCKVMKADVCGSGRARLRDLHSQPHERFMMLTRVCGCVCVCVCVSVRGWGGVVGWGWKKGTRRDREKGKEGGGIRVQSVRQIDGAQQG